MAMEYNKNNEIMTENVIFIGLLCTDGLWKAVIFEIGISKTIAITSVNIHDISYSFDKKIKTQDITINNYQQFLNPTESQKAQWDVFNLVHYVYNVISVKTDEIKLLSI